MNIEAHPGVSLSVAYLTTLFLLVSVGCTLSPHDRALATSLANEKTRKAAIDSIMASGRHEIPLLLSWARTPPRHVEECGFEDGVVEALGQLRATEAIPFLIKDISMYRSCGASFGPWLKSPAFIEWNLPAVGALVKIGPDASRAVIAAFPTMTDEEDRRAAVFVVARIKGVAEAESFLKSVSARAGREQYWAEEGIKLLETSTSPGR